MLTASEGPAAAKAKVVNLAVEGKIPAFTASVWAPLRRYRHPRKNKSTDAEIKAAAIMGSFVGVVCTA